MRVVGASSPEPVRPEIQAADTADLLYGVGEIASFLGLREPQVRGHVERGLVPTFKIGGKVCARRASLTRWLNELEKAAAGRRVQS